VLGLIARETEHARLGRPAAIVAKMNALVDADVITALYAASQAGVKIDLLIRGICCLRPGVKGVSDDIRVHAVIDRFLEHSRLFHFKNGGEDEVFASSADWMPRNFRRRVEMMWPIVDEQLKRRAIDEILGTVAADSANGWELDQSGIYRRVRPEIDAKPMRSQLRFMELSRERLREGEPMLSRKLAPAPSPDVTFEKLRRKRKKKTRDRGRDD
jgi:polyphosphate kinase